MLCGEGYLSQNSGTEIFGVGTNSVIDYVRVYWLSGIVDEIQNVTVNQTLEIVECSFILSDDAFEYDPSISVVHEFQTQSYFISSKNNIKSYELSSISGLRMLTKKRLDVKNLRLFLTQFQSGIYVLEITTEKGKSVHKILID